MEYSIPVVVETADMAIPTIEGELCDVSAQGAMLVVSEKLHSGLFVKIKLKMKNELEPLVGYVKWQKKVDDRYRFGIVFDETFDEQNDKVIEFVTEEIISEIRKKREKVD